MDLGPVHLVGHSLGGYVSIRVTVRHPELVRCLVLVAPAGVPDDRALFGYVGRLFRAARQLRPRFAVLLAHDFLRAGPSAILSVARELISEDIREDLGRIRHPTLLVWGADDPMIPAPVGALLRSEIPHSRLLVLDDVGHVPMIDRFDEFNSAILDFLRGEEVGD